EHGLLVVTRADLAEPAMIDATLATAREHLAGSSLAGASHIVVSARETSDLAMLRSAIGDFVREMATPGIAAPLRIWVDRAFTIGGAGTVVTGTLGEGKVAVGDGLVLIRAGEPDAPPRQVRVRTVQSREQSRAEVEPVARVALNLRGISTAEIGRGDVLLCPGSFALGRTIDIACPRAADLPDSLTLHVGSADLAVRARALGAGHARVTLPGSLPWRVGDRVILRDPG